MSSMTSDLEELAGKTLVTTTVNDERITAFRDCGRCHLVIDGAPCLHGHVWSTRRCSTR